ALKVSLNDKSEWCAKLNQKPTKTVKATDLQLIWQLIGAELNCQLYGCRQEVQDLINQAEDCYCSNPTGSSCSSLAGQLDVFNNSGEDFCSVTTSSSIVAADDGSGGAQPAAAGGCSLIMPMKR